MSEVVLHIYDVTNSASQRTNSAIVQLNKVMKDAIGLGGIFHSAVQVYGEEWSFGFCESGTGVFSCPPKRNPMYTYRESLVLGYTTQSADKVAQILRELSGEWPGYSYDLLAKNCNHFCDDFCERLGVQKLPAWVNRFANAGDTAIEVAESTAEKFRQAKDEIITASKVAYRFLVGNSASPNASENQGSAQVQRSSSGSNGVFQASWLKNLSSLKFSANSQDGSSYVQTEESNASYEKGSSVSDVV
eukprot:TRINITY_DN6052_c0_g1_i2.p1 TRINITY_DN6052_c0_g1~~TRINITY_DN6052_c0_g1_i2.p1  ORF type:complete len:246 (-),score=53.46 TRINITY_DN6052_c0_g1_i2:70-807(-)